MSGLAHEHQEWSSAYIQSAAVHDEASLDTLLDLTLSAQYPAIDASIG